VIGKIRSGSAGWVGVKMEVKVKEKVGVTVGVASTPSAALQTHKHTDTETHRNPHFPMAPARGSHSLFTPFGRGSHSGEQDSKSIRICPKALTKP
jgi:hypothetical protein